MIIIAQVTERCKVAEERLSTNGIIYENNYHEIGK